MRNFFEKNRGLILSRKGWKHAADTLKRRLETKGRRDVTGTGNPTRIFGGQHKAMTTYLSAVMQNVGAAYNIPFKKCAEGIPEIENGGFVLNFTSRFDVESKDFLRAKVVKIVRDPRDIIVSSYKYHLWTDESWANTRWNGAPSYRERLNAMTRSDGLMKEVDRAIKKKGNHYGAWMNPPPNTLVIRYEDLMGEERETLYRKIFAHWDFEEEIQDFGVNAMKIFDFSSRTGRKLGQSSSGNHLRSGVSGSWKNDLESKHLIRIEEGLGDVLKSFQYI